MLQPMHLDAQASMADKSDGVLVEELKEIMPDSLVKARPILLELSKRLEGKSDQETYIFLIGLSYQDEYSESQDTAALKKATEYYLNYLENFPTGTRKDFVRFNLAGAYAYLDDFDNAIQYYEESYQRSGNAIFRSESRNRMASLYIKEGKADQGIPLFLDVFSAAVLDPELRAQAASWLVQGYLTANQPAEILPYLRYLTGRYEAIYDPAFNITLLKAGDDLFQKQNYDQAILLYSFVKARSEIIEFYEDRVDQLTLKVRYIDPKSEQFMVVDGQLKAAQARLAAVREIREYDVDMKWRIARVYKETKRTWESLWAFVHLYEDFPEHEQVEDFLYTAYGEARELKDDSMAEQLALDYMAEPEFKKFRGQIIMGLAQMYSKARRYEKLMELVNDYLKNPENYVVAAQLMNVVGSYYIVDAEYLNLRDYMEPLQARFKGKEPLYEATRYWSGLSFLLLADYAKASETFKSFIADYNKQSVYYEDVFYRYAVALFGEQKMSDSEAQFVRFVDTYPDSGLRGEAELYIGDLQRDRGAFSDAAEHYLSVEQHTKNDAFIAKAIFARSEVLEQMGESQQAVDELIAYVERYGQRGQISDAYYRIGMIFDRLGQLNERFKLHAMAVNELISDAYRYSVDELIVSYVTDYVHYETTFHDSIQLLDRLIAEEDFRIHFLTDRAYQYQFMQSAEGINVDDALSYSLIRDRAFRSKIIETVIPVDPETGEPITPKGEIVTTVMVIQELQQLKELYEAKAASIADFSPQFLFGNLVKQGHENEDVVMEMRAQMALDILASEQTEPHFPWEQLLEAPPSVIIWEAAKYRKTQPEATKELYEVVLKEHPYSKSVYDALLALGDLTYSKAEETGNPADWNEALRYYNLVTERYAMRSRTAMAHLRKGRILSELSKDTEAIDVLGQILRNPKWKGLDHAKAHLELGLAYRRQGNLREAHGFFERLIVAYGGYAETVSWAYYYDLLTLEELNEQEAVQQLIEEYRTRESVLSTTEAYPLIKEKYEL
jgi:TolA-binding protein